MTGPRKVMVGVALAVLLAALVAALYLARSGTRSQPDSKDSARATAGQGSGASGPGSRAPGPSRPGLDLVRVRGAVRDIETRAGLEGVDLELASPDRATVSGRTGPDGLFEVSLAPGRWQARILGDALLAVDSARFTIEGGAGSRALELLVWRMARVEGRVVDGRGEPLARVSVRAAAAGDDDSVAPEDAAAPADPTARPPATTDDAGRFSLAIPPGRVVLLARADALPESTTTLRWVEPGAHLAGVEIVMDAGASVSGQVVDESGQPVPGAEVTAATEGLYEVRRTTSDNQGRFALHALAPGRVLLEARRHADADAPGYAPGAVAAVTLEPGGERRDITLRVTAARAIAGQVVDEAGAPVADASLEALPAMGRASPALARSDDTGAFHIDGLGAGPYIVRARAPDLAPLALTGVEPPALDLRIIMTRAGRVSGRVSHARDGTLHDFWVRLDRNPASPAGADAPGAAIPLEGAAERFLTPDGRYQVTGVTPGVYDVSFFAPGVAPETVRGVRVPAAGEAEVSVTLAPGATLRVTVTEAESGRAVRGAGVRLSTGSESPLGYTDPHGRVTLHDIAPGRRTLEVSHPAYVDRFESGVEVAPGRAVDVPVALERIAPGAHETVEFAGIGAVLAMEDGGLRVRELLPHGPAEVAGLLPGDEIAHIDGRSARDRGMAENIEDIRGVAGSVVRLVVVRDGEPFERDVVRGNVRFRPGPR